MNTVSKFTSVIEAKKVAQHQLSFYRKMMEGKEMKETYWFPLTVLPVRVGVYKTRHRGTDGILYEGFSRWDGHKWGYTYSKPFNSPYSYLSTQQSREWKGIYKETS